MYAPPLTPTSEFARAASAGFFCSFSIGNLQKCQWWLRLQAIFDYLPMPQILLASRSLFFNKTHIKLNFTLPVRATCKLIDS